MPSRFPAGDRCPPAVPRARAPNSANGRSSLTTLSTHDKARDAHLLAAAPATCRMTHRWQRHTHENSRATYAFHVKRTTQNRQRVARTTSDSRRTPRARQTHRYRIEQATPTNSPLLQSADCQPDALAPNEEDDQARARRWTARHVKQLELNPAPTSTQSTWRSNHLRPPGRSLRTDDG